VSKARRIYFGPCKCCERAYSVASARASRPYCLLSVTTSEGQVETLNCVTNVTWPPARNGKLTPFQSVGVLLFLHCSLKALSLFISSLCTAHLLRYLRQALDGSCDRSLDFLHRSHLISLRSLPLFRVFQTFSSCTKDILQIN
jgi:hypothetical protein